MKISVYGVPGYYGEFDVEQLCGARGHIINGGLVDVGDKRFLVLQMNIGNDGEVSITVDNSRNKRELKHTMIEGTLAEFHSKRQMKQLLKKAGVTPPDGWNGTLDEFIVKEDRGPVLRLSFYDWIADEQLGDAEFEVARGDVKCFVC